MNFENWLAVFHKMCDVACENYPDDRDAYRYFKAGCTPKESLDHLIQAGDGPEPGDGQHL